MRALRALCIMIGAFSPFAAIAAPGDGETSAFYRWADTVPATPGRMLRREPLPAALALEQAGASDRILYSSASGFGPARPIAISGMVFRPKGTPPAGGWPVIAWAHGTTGVADVCAPSWMPHSQRDADYLNGWLAQGYAIVATDYEGLGTPGAHPYMVTRSAAYSVLDAVRAARRADPALGARTVIVGQSQGAHAALAAALLGSRYAPDIKIVGVVATGVPGEKGFEAAADASPSPIARAAPIDPSVPRDRVRGLAMGGFDGWALVYLEYFASYATIDRTFDPAEWLTARGLALFAETVGGCKGPATAAFIAEKPPLSAIFRKDPTPYEARWVALRRYPDPAFPMPIFIGIGLADTYTAPELSFNVARSACLRGSIVSVRFYPGLGHSEAVLPSQRDSSIFVRDVLAGRMPSNDCPALRWPGRG